MPRSSAFTLCGQGPVWAVAGEAAEASGAPVLEDMPEWDLGDLYTSPQAAEVGRDLERAGEAARELKATYQAWRKTARTPEGRPELVKTCQAAAQKAQRAFDAYGCWIVK